MIWVCKTKINLHMAVYRCMYYIDYSFKFVKRAAKSWSFKPFFENFSSAIQEYKIIFLIFLHENLHWWIYPNYYNATDPVKLIEHSPSPSWQSLFLFLLVKIHTYLPSIGTMAKWYYHFTMHCDTKLLISYEQ